MEHRIEACPFVQILDALVPLMGDQVVDLLQKIVTASLVEPVQVIAVPKLFLGCTPQRSAVRRTQMAEQLMDVPTEPGYALAVIATKALGCRAAAALAEQIVDNPVLHGGGGRGGPQSFLLGHDSTTFCGADRVENPVSRSGGLQGSRPRLASSASSAHLPSAADEAFTGRDGFSHFSPNFLKVRGWARTRGRNCLRSRAHPRGELVPCPWFPRTSSQRRSRSPRSRRTVTSGWVGPGVSG